jgi:hypothetical protein
MTKFVLSVATEFAASSASRTRFMDRLIRSAFGLVVGAALLVAAGSTPAHAQFAGPVPLTLINGWTNAPFGTSIATVEEVSGIVQFRGAIATSGTNAEPFTLPLSLSPATEVYIPIDLCNATNGRLLIEPTGAVFVQAEGGTFSNAQCFTSLDGASFSPNSTGFTALPLINGWTNAPFSTSNAAAKLINGIVHFEGAIATAGTNTQPFVMPKAMRPLTDVYVPVDLCNATVGRLHIQPTGTVFVEAAVFSNAQCFTSLDGAWYAPKPTGFKALTLINGWTNAPFVTSNAAAANVYGLVYFKGAIATTGTNAQPFTLPTSLRPITNVYVPIDLCGATKGRLIIQSNGVVLVQAEGAFSNAQCFTSLDGASFVQ